MALARRKHHRPVTAKNPRARHRRFLAAGFFPPEVPPCFYSEMLARFRNSLTAEFLQLPNKNGNPDYYHYLSKPTPFNFPRFRSVDRRHSVVNPVAYFWLSKVLSDNYVKLNGIAKKSKISASPSIFDWTGSRTLKRPSFDSRDTFISDVNARFEYIVNTDIRAFYHSVYTHAIAWAVHGKRVTKKNRSDALVGNLIDRLSRNLQDGQTIGLPVGPDTSRLIAELVGAAIDVHVQKATKTIDGRGIRFVDDFTLGCADKVEADRAVAIIRRAVNEFELDLNSEKTSVSAGTTVPPGGWKALVRSLVPVSSSSADDLEIFFFKISDLARQMPDINVERYAMQNARRAIVQCDSWKPAENYLISAYKANATLINLLVELFILREQSGHGVSTKTLASFVEARLPLLCDQRRNGEAVWLLFMAIVLKIPLKARSVEPYFTENDPLIALLIADAKSQQLISGKVDFSNWNKHLTTDSLDDEMWLYAYESTLKNLNTSSTGDGFVRAHRYFSKLLERKIEFYRSGEGVSDISSILHRRRLENAAAHRIAADFDEDFSFEIDELDDEADFGDTDY